MIMEMDEGKRFVKTCWSAMRHHIANVEPIFAHLVDELSPDDSFVLYLAHYPYGAIKDNTYGNGYGSAPLALVLEKQFELFVDRANEKITIPRTLYSPGSFFPLARLLSQQTSRAYAPNRLLTMTSGVRSVFLLPNVGCANHHSNLQRDYQVKQPPPKTLYDQWGVFKEIVASEQAACQWQSCLMYFSHQWLDKILHDKKWQGLKLYLHELAWKQYDYQRNHYYYDFIFSLIQKKRNLKPNPYLVDTAKHLFTTALGAAPGYIPAVDDNALPLSVLQRAFSESYGLNKYHPVMMQPTHFDFEQAKNPVYYSLQYPSTHVFSPKSRKSASMLAELRELEHITSIFREELAHPNSSFAGTMIHRVSSNMVLSFFHSEPDTHHVIFPSSSMPMKDDRFYRGRGDCGNSLALFPADGAFVRGCASVSGVA